MVMSHVTKKPAIVDFIEVCKVELKYSRLHMVTVIMLLMSSLLIMVITGS